MNKSPVNLLGKLYIYVVSFKLQMYGLYSNMKYVGTHAIFNLRGIEKEGRMGHLTFWRHL